MLLKEAEEILKKNGYRLVEDTEDSEDLEIEKDEFARRVKRRKATMKGQFDIYDHEDKESLRHPDLTDRIAAAKKFNGGITASGDVKNDFVVEIEDLGWEEAGQDTYGDDAHLSTLHDAWYKKIGKHHVFIYVHFHKDGTKAHYEIDASTRTKSTRHQKTVDIDDGVQFADMLDNLATTMVEG